MYRWSWSTPWLSAAAAGDAATTRATAATRRALARRDIHVEVLDPVDEVGQQAVRLADGGDVRRPGQQLPEHDGDLAASQVGAEAEVGAGTAEARVGVRVAGQVEAERLVEHVLVPVGRVVEQHDLVAGRERVVAQRRPVLGHGAPEVDDRAGPPHDL